MDSGGNAYLSGYFYGQVTFGPHTLNSYGSSDVYTAKLDPSGNWLWAVQAGGLFADYGLGIALDNTGNVYLTGDFIGTAVFGTHSLTSSGQQDIFAAKLDSAGNWLWVIQAGGAGYEKGRDIVVDNLGVAYLTGWFSSAGNFGSHPVTPNGTLDDIFVAKLGTAESVAIPTFSPAPGTYATAQNVSLACLTAGAVIRFTTNGADPTETSTPYTNPINCPLNTTTTIKARAFKAGWDPSPVATAVYVVTNTVSEPVFAPSPGVYPAATDVSITCGTAAAEIRYTTNGSDPTASSALYVSPIHITQSTTIKARAFKTDWAPSAVITAVYQVGVASGDELAVPLFTGIHNVFPNPFTAGTTIKLGLKESSGYTLKIYNVRGEMVYQSTGQSKGFVDLAWNGRDDQGHVLPSGIYLLAFACQDIRQMRQIVKTD